MQTATRMKRTLTNVYFDSRPLEERDYRRGRNLFVLEGCCANGVGALSAGAFLSGLLSSLGASDSLNGIIGAIPTLVCVAQLFSSVVLENLKDKKLIIALLAFLHRVLLACLFFVPFMVEGQTTRLILVVFLFSVAHLSGTFIGTGASNWIRQMVPGERLGNYLGIRDAWGLGVTTVITLGMGQMLDHFRSSGREYDGFLMIGAAILAMTFVNFYCLSAIKEPKEMARTRKVKLMDVLVEPLKDRQFRKVIIFYILWNVSLQISAPFYAVYMVTGLKLNYTYITLVGLIASVSRVAAAAVWGRLADRKSWLWLTKMSMLVLGITHFAWIFMTKETYPVLQPLLQMTSGIAWGGIAISMFNLQYLFAPAESRVMFVGANSAYAGVCGFAAALVGAALISVLKPVVIGAFTITGMQMVFAISGIMIAGCVYYVKRVLE